MTEMQKLAVTVTLEAAFAGPMFDICQVTHACEVVGIPNYHKHPHWPVLRAFHCKTWETLGMGNRATIAMMVAEMFGWEPSTLRLGTPA
jgi:hypothetical protein